MLPHQHVTTLIQNDDSIPGLAVAGFWRTNKPDEFSDRHNALV